MNVDEMEQVVYDKIDALQAEIKQRQIAINGLLTMLPCEYIIVRTFLKEWQSHSNSYKAGHVSYFPENIALNGWVTDKSMARVFKSLRDAQYYIDHTSNYLKDYIEIKIERVAK